MVSNFFSAPEFRLDLNWFLGRVFPPGTVLAPPNCLASDVGGPGSSYLNFGAAPG